MISHIHHWGTRFARTFYTFEFVVMFALNTSCLVTENGQVPAEENLPPSIISAPQARSLGVALDQIVDINLSEFEGSELQIPVIIRDPNVDQTLEYQLYVDYQGNIDALVRSGDIEPLVSAEENGKFAFERPRTFSVEVVELGQPGRCHRIELLVTSEFDRGVSFREPVLPGDIAHAVWWVRLTDETNLTVEMDTCP